MICGRLDRSWALLGAIVVLGLLPRLYQLDAPYYVNGHAWRQADSAAFVDGYLQHGFNLFSPRIAKQPCQLFDAPFGAVESELPIIAWLSALPLAAMGIGWAPPWYLRSVSIGLWVLSCLSLFLLARRFSGEEDEPGQRMEALIAVAAYSLFPIAVFYSRSPQPDAPSLLFVISFLLFLDRWLEREKLVDAAIGAVCAAVMLLLKASNAYALPVGLYLVLRRRSVGEVAKSWRMWAFAVVALVPAVAWYRYAATAHAHTFDIWTFRKFTQWEDYLDTEHWKWFGLRFTIPVLTAAGCLTSILGVSVGKKPGLPRAWFAACVLFLLVAIKANRTHVYYQLIYVVPGALATAKAVLWLWRRGAVGKAALSMLLTAHLAIGFGVLWDYDDPGELWGYYRIDLPHVREAIPLLKDNIEEGERFVSILDHPALFIGAQRLGYIPETWSSPGVIRCMQKGVQYALVPLKWFQPPGVRVIAVSRHYKLWHRVPHETFPR